MPATTAVTRDLIPDHSLPDLFVVTTRYLRPDGLEETTRIIYAGRGGALAAQTCGLLSKMRDRTAVLERVNHAPERSDEEEQRAIYLVQLLYLAPEGEA